MTPPPAGSDARRVIFFSDNGHGLGHITRLMAIARRLPAGYVPLFFTLSESHPVVRRMGYAVEFFPSARKLRAGRPVWDEFIHARLSELFDEIEPCAIVIDHVNPPVTLGRLRQEHPDVAFVWSRRGLWREGRNLPSLDLHGSFDRVIEPMDVASPFDLGPTTRFRDSLIVPPVTLLSSDELDDRPSARRALGLPEDGLAVLLQLSADRPEALHDLIQHARDLWAETGPVTLFAPLHVLHAHALDPVDGVHMQPVYPVSRYLNAFDAAVSTAGYNSFHELIMAGVPTVFVARATDSLDDQQRRAEVAHLAGASLHVADLDSADARSAIEQLRDPDLRERMRRSANVLYPGNGAQATAQAVVAEVAGLTKREPVPRLEPSVEVARRLLMSGPALQVERRETTPIVLFVALDHDDGQLLDLAEQIAALQAETEGFKPVLLIGIADTYPLVQRSLQYETVMPADRWADLALRGTYAAYCDRRVLATERLYAPATVLRPPPGEPIELPPLGPPLGESA